MHRRTEKAALCVVRRSQIKNAGNSASSRGSPCDLTGGKPSKLAHVLTHFHALCAVSYLISWRNWQTQRDLKAGSARRALMALTRPQKHPRPLLSLANRGVRPNLRTLLFFRNGSENFSKPSSLRKSFASTAKR